MGVALQLRMNGAMVPVSEAENVKMTVKSGKAPEEHLYISLRSLNCFLEEFLKN